MAAGDTSDEELIGQFLREIDDYSQREAADMVDGVNQNDISRWIRGDWQWLTAAKRRSLKEFLRHTNRSKLDSVKVSPLGDPTGSPAEQLIYHLSHPEITRRFQDHPPMDFVKAAFAYGLEEDFSSEEMDKLEAWRQEVLEAADGESGT